MTEQLIITVNAGSSSLKFGVVRLSDMEEIGRAEVESIGTLRGPSAKGRGAHLEEIGQPPEGLADHAGLTAWALDRIAAVVHNLGEVAAVGHRVVHGGARFDAPVVVDDAVITALEGFVALAPNHQPHNLSGIAATRKLWPDLPQVACFDTAFHRSQPRIAQTMPIPRELSDEGVLRYGFHGLSYAHIAHVLPDHAGPRADGRVIVAHLGHGASLCGMLARRSVATTMGFTALDGLMMGKRSGAIDPGVVLHLIRDRGMTAAEVDRLLNARSGLLGVSGVSDDMRVLETSPDPKAEEAMALFAYRAGREAGSVAVAIGGLDVLVFTAGIGRYSAAMRARIAAHLGFLGVTLDPAANAAHGPVISAADSPVLVLALDTDEEAVIARETARLIFG
ncbi:acetate/propionate family kinase [Tistrella mobilis]|uniref:Acetate kinase n=1 Tax=Tistrella mobilis TaxID=171437 RepID=A0A162KV01_9PROT|nr:acetate/propionate family kinase [Tistrella mobilis]KYO52182.1 acetate kinase [Tistrella mobilis]